MLTYFLESIENESDKDYILWLYNEFEKLNYFLQRHNAK